MKMENRDFGSGRAFRIAFVKPIVWGILLLMATVAHGQRGGRGGFGAESGLRVEPKDLTFDLGVGEIPDRKTFESLSYQGPDVMRDSYLADLEFVKFIIEGIGTAEERVYFMNTNNHRAHPRFMPMVGIDRRHAVRGAITYLPRLTAPDQSAGLYTVDFQPNESWVFEEIQSILGVLARKMPVLEGKVAFHPLMGNMDQYERDRSKYDSSKIAVHLDSDLYKNISYLPMNEAESFGRLRVMENEARPSPRDIVIYKTLPNQMPRVAGVITEVRQTPLSHVNLRAVQDRVPNAYIRAALKKESIQTLLGKWVRFRVTSQGYSLEEVDSGAVDRHFASLRPAESQTPRRNLDLKEIRSLGEIGFGDADGYGLKAANLAAMHRFELPQGTVPRGYAVPFSFYVDFMKATGLNREVGALLENDSLLADPDALRDALKSLRKRIRGADAPAYFDGALDQLKRLFPKGTSLRCRSSTNNEDLPGFSGAGLYDSYTHREEEGPLSKTVQQVYASLWNFRAFEERAFYRVDHQATAMGVLIHPNYKGERANGVAVTDDILYETYGNYYLNTQLGEDLVTNPNAASSPEEILLGWRERDGHEVVRRSRDAPGNNLLLQEDHLSEIRADLTIIHEGFRQLYGRDPEDQFAMEIEYKVTAEGKLVIKQARPWVF